MSKEKKTATKCHKCGYSGIGTYTADKDGNYLCINCLKGYLTKELMDTKAKLTKSKEGLRLKSNSVRLLQEQLAIDNEKIEYLVSVVNDIGECLGMDMTIYGMDDVKWSAEDFTEVIKELKEQNENMKCCVEELQNPYPEDIFKKISENDFDKINKYLEKGGYSLSCISGNIGRRLWDNWSKELLDNLTQKDREV